VSIAVLAMILSGNLYVLKFKPERLQGHDAALLFALGLNVIIPLNSFVGMNSSLQIVASCVLVFTPIFFAGIVFATSFNRGAAARSTSP